VASDAFRLTRLPNGTFTVHSLAYQEKMHPGLGPAAEAELLYVSQLKIRERLRQHAGEFVVWDIGLGAAANALTLLRLTRDASCPLQLVSFDETSNALGFALENAPALGYLHGYESSAEAVMKDGHTGFQDGGRRVNWRLQIADFPRLIACQEAGSIPKPHAIMFDAFSPARNPAMWALPLFENLFRLLDSAAPCALATYSRSTMVRVALLLAGFFVGRGRPTGMKEETTVAANSLPLLDEPLDRAWLQRARKSSSAEPLSGAVYRQAPLSPETWKRLQQHPQFA
jgi:tRNA U34 5-methylaminomethyl-2-thiouridine-forming methyltransferase MnmC